MPDGARALSPAAGPGVHRQLRRLIRVRANRRPPLRLRTTVCILWEHVFNWKWARRNDWSGRRTLESNLL